MKKRKLSIISCALLGLLSSTLLFGCAPSEDTSSNVSGSNLVGIAITKNPDKMDYAVGSDFDKTGMEVTAKYIDESTKVVEDYRLFGDKNLQLGARVTVIYVEGVKKTTELKLNVVEKNIVGYEFGKPLINDYLPGEYFEPEGFKVYAVYDDGDKAEISDFEILTEIVPEDGKIQVKIDNETKEYTVNVKKGVTVSGLEVTGLKEEYFPGAELRPGLVVTAKYSDNTSRVINKGWTMSKEKTEVGDTGVTITYLDYSQTFNFKVIKDERTGYVIEGESAIIESKADLRKTASSSDKNNVNYGNFTESGAKRLDPNTFSGRGFLKSFASKNYTLTYKFNSTKAAPAKLLFNAIGKGNMNEMFAKATLNGKDFPISKAPLTEGTTFTEAEIGEAALVAGENTLVLSCLDNRSFYIDQLIVKTASVVTPLCEKDHQNIAWTYREKVGDASAYIYRVCDICKHYEKVDIPELTSAGITAGKEVPATEFTAGYTPYTYVKGGVTYNFNVYGANATGETHNAFFDFCSVPVEVAKYQRYPGVYVANDEGKAAVTNGLPINKGFKTDAINGHNANAISPQSNGGEVGMGTFKIKFNADKAATAIIKLRVASHKVMSFHLNDVFDFNVNGVAYMSETDFLKNNGKNFFNFKDEILTTVNLKQGLNTIDFSLIAKFPNVDGISIESGCVITAA